ncbi:aspartyl protease family protein [Arthrospira platensis BEA 1257B]
MGKLWDGLGVICIVGLTTATVAVGAVGAVFPSLKSGWDLRAIVQLEGLNLPRPQTTGESQVSLHPIEGSQVFAVDVEIGESRGGFLFDTGASTTMVGSPLVADLGLVGEEISGDRVKSAVAGDDCPEMDATLHRLPTLKMGEAQVMDLQVLEFANKTIPDGLSGVLGMDVLAEFDLIVNPETRQLQLLSPSPLPPHLSATAIPLKSRLGVMLAEVAIADRGSFTFMLDTGVDTIFISEDLADRLEIDPASRSPVQVLGFCGLEAATLSTLTTVELGTHKLTNLEAVILSSPSVLDMLEVDGILGQTFFNNYQQYWRFDRRSTSSEWGGSLLLNPYR